MITKEQVAELRKLVADHKQDPRWSKDVLDRIAALLDEVEDARALLHDIRAEIQARYPSQ